MFLRTDCDVSFLCAKQAPATRTQRFPKEPCCFMSSYFQESCFFFLECTPSLFNSFDYSKIHPNCLCNFTAFPSFCRNEGPCLVLVSLNLIHGSHNPLYSTETISRLLCSFSWNVSSLKTRLAIYSFVFQASHTPSDGARIKKTILSLVSFLASLALAFSLIRGVTQNKIFNF